MDDRTDDHTNEPEIAPVHHPFLQTQLAYDHSQDFAPSYTRALWEKQHSWIADDVNRTKPSRRIRVLDVGCGPAHIAESLKEHIEIYVGVDTSFVELRRAKPQPGRFFIHGIGEQLDYLPNNSFDAVLFISVLDHVIDWKRTINRCADVLRPGGIMLIVMENEDQLVNRLRRLMGRQIEHSDHMHYFTLSDISKQLGARFTSLKVTTFGYGFGLHKLTTKVPIPQPFFKLLIPIIDSVGGLLSPEGGQVLYGLYQKNGDASLEPSSDFLVCPSCKAPIVWRQSTCRQCGSSMPYDGDIMDALAMLKRPSA
jgi:ubiquinone/menaquinone biosynthesis C-methylase UbiE